MCAYVCYVWTCMSTKLLCNPSPGKSVIRATTVATHGTCTEPRGVEGGRQKAAFCPCPRSTYLSIPAPPSPPRQEAAEALQKGGAVRRTPLCTTCRGAWARITIDHFRHLARYTKAHSLPAVVVLGRADAAGRVHRLAAPREPHRAQGAELYPDAGPSPLLLLPKSVSLRNRTRYKPGEVYMPVSKFL